MRFDPQAGQTAPEKSENSRRRYGRLPQDTVISNVGAVLDISAGGMRVLSLQKPLERTLIRLDGQELPGPLRAELAWSKRVGMFSFKREAGYRFVDVTPEMSKCLSSIAGTNRYRRAM